MGTLGDLVGRSKALALTLSLTVLGALISALASWGTAERVYEVVCLGRFILGVGVGGIYPLSATSSSDGGGDKAASVQRVGWAFFWQAPGAMAPYLVALALLSVRPDGPAPGPDGPAPDSGGVTSGQFRVLLGLGALPAAMVLFLTLAEPAPAPEPVQEGGAGRPRASLWGEISAHPEYATYLLGTGGTWFLYDVSYYGTSIFLPIMLRTIFDDNGGGQLAAAGAGGLAEQCWHAILVTGLGIPGCIAAILLMAPPRGPRTVLVLGFVLMTVAFTLTGLAMWYAPTNKALSIAMLCVVSFAINCGPNVATYVLPTVVYHAEVKATFHGFSAGCGKLGAVVGTFLYAPILDLFGLPAVMWTQAAVSLLAGGLALATIPADDDHNAAAAGDAAEALLDAA